MITYLLPTRDRHEALQQTLDALGSLSAAAHEIIGGAEIVVVDNASTPPVRFPETLLNGLPLRIVRLEQNLGAAARNIGAQEACGEWIIMLDDDSHPLDCGHIEALRNAPREVAAIGAEIFLPDGRREAGGLPEVVIGCGVAIRREIFLEVGGYDPTFDYYAEEYDLCAKFIIHGWRIVHDRRFRVLHKKITTHRDMNRILHRLVRNNCWVAQRYAPLDLRQIELTHTVSRYAAIAVKENAACGFAQGVDDLLRTLVSQPQRTMAAELFERFAGLAHVRATMAHKFAILRCATVAIVDDGKNAEVIRQSLSELGAQIAEHEAEADVLVIGTLSPGPMLDAWERRVADPDSCGRPVLCGWRLMGERTPSVAAAA